MNERPQTMALLAALRFDYDTARRELDLLDDIELVVLRGAAADLQLDITVLQQERARRRNRMHPALALAPNPPTPSRNDSVTTADLRTCPACGDSFVVNGRRRWCSDACRQRAFRVRHRSTDPTPPLPRQLPRAVVVYQCPECETRYLGVQRCDDCGIFCRRLGPGGHCPHCDEPVVVSDLGTAPSAP